MSLHRRILLSSETTGPDLSSPPVSVIYVDITVNPPRQLSNGAIAALSAVSAAIFLALAYFSVLRHRRHSRRRPLSTSATTNNNNFSDDDDDSSYEIPAGGVHHYDAWNIRTVGIDDSSILNLGSYAYLPSSSGNVTAHDCSVCLGELAEGEMVRLLPRCGHVFHVPCIDTWLRAHVSCPVCRANILPLETLDHKVDEVEAPEAPPPPAIEEDEAVVPEIPVEPTPVVVVNDTEAEERIGEENSKVEILEEKTKVEALEESSSKEELESSASGRVFIFARMTRGRSSSILPL